MKKKIIINILMLIIIFFFSYQQYSYATSILDTGINGGDDFIQTGKSYGGSQLVNPDGLEDASDALYNAFLIIGIIVAVLVGAVLGIQFMLGSMETQAKIKESLIPYLVGCVIIFGSLGIWKIVVIVAEKID